MNCLISLKSFQNTLKLDLITAAHQLVYGPLPCSPSSPDLNEFGNGIIRGVFNVMLVTAKASPVDWPAGIDWDNYPGTSSPVSHSDAAHDSSKLCTCRTDAALPGAKYPPFFPCSYLYIKV